jgi:RNA polymerase sigma-70 factor (ECF subfamily)
VGRGSRKPPEEPPEPQLGKPDRPVDDTETGRARSVLVRLAYRFLWNVEDAVQDALTIVQAKGEQLKDQSKWWSWVRRIVVNQCHEQQRRRWRHERHTSALADRQASSHPTDTALDREELSGILKSLIAELPEQKQTAIVLRHIDGMSYQQIAEIMQVSESTVRVHVRAAREALREKIMKRYPEWANDR